MPWRIYCGVVLVKTHLRTVDKLCRCIYVCIYKAAAQKHRACNTGGLFATRLAQNQGSCDPPSDNPIEECSTLQAHDKGLEQRQGTATNPCVGPHPEMCI